MCLTPAMQGGATPLMSSFAVHNAILAERPDLLNVLYRGFHYGSETVIKGGLPITEHRIPVFTFVAGEPDCFFLPAAIRGPNGEPREALPAIEQEAIAYLQAVANRPDMKIDMVIDPATVQFINNRVILHARADYQDWPQSERKRHLLRMWLMMPDWPKRPPEVQMLRSTDRAGDYVVGCKALLPYADYLVCNVSSPNTPGLRELQFGRYLEDLLDALRERGAALAGQWGRRVPLAVKIAPDLDDAELVAIGRILVERGIDAVIATNTTVAREGLPPVRHGGEQGGLSGAPLLARSTAVVRRLTAEFGPRLPVIAAGGIGSGADATAKFAAGAVLVQLYTGFIYRGPRLLREALAASAKIS